MCKRTEVEEILLEYIESYGLTDRARGWFMSNTIAEADEPAASTWPAPVDPSNTSHS